MKKYKKKKKFKNEEKLKKARKNDIIHKIL